MSWIYWTTGTTGVELFVAVWALNSPHRFWKMKQCKVKKNIIIFFWKKKQNCGVWWFHCVAGWRAPRMGEFDQVNNTRTIQANSVWDIIPRGRKVFFWTKNSTVKASNTQGSIGKPDWMTWTWKVLNCMEISGHYPLTWTKQKKPRKGFFLNLKICDLWRHWRTSKQRASNISPSYFERIKSNLGKRKKILTLKARQ